MDDDKKLPVTVAKNETVAAPPFSAVRKVSGWALLTAFVIAVFPALVIYILSYFDVHCTPSSIVVRCVYLTAAEAAEKAALWHGFLFCAGLQTTAAALAALLPSRRRRMRILRHGLAFVALAATTLGHCMLATGAGLVLANDPGYLYRSTSTDTILLLAVGDTAHFIALLLPLGDEDD